MRNLLFGLCLLAAIAWQLVPARAVHAKVLAGAFEVGSASAQGQPSCDDSLWKHLYHSPRLQVHQLCATVTGTIVDASHGKNKDGCRHEADGDGHCFLKLDAGQEKFLNQKNLDNEDGALVFEPICHYRVTQADAKAACKDWKQNLVLPPVGSHVRMTGSWVTDLQHGHNEIHPVSAIEIIK
jgi:hypothetical protein